MGVERVSEFVRALIGVHVRVGGSAQEREAHDVALDVIAVLAIVEQGDAVAALGEVSPAVRGDFVLGAIPGGIPVRRALHRAELDFVGGFERPDVHRKGRLQQDLLLVPVYVGGEFEAARMRIQAHLLGDGGFLHPPDEP